MSHYPYSSVYFLKLKSFFLNNHSTMLKLRKITLIQCFYLTHRPYSNLKHCLKNVIPNQDSIRDHVTFTCHISLVFFNLKLLTNLSRLFCRISFNLDFSDISFWLGSGYHFSAFWLRSGVIRFRLYIFGRNTT